MTSIILTAEGKVIVDSIESITSVITLRTELAKEIYLSFRHHHDIEVSEFLARSHCIVNEPGCLEIIWAKQQSSDSKVISAFKQILSKEKHKCTYSHACSEHGLIYSYDTVQHIIGAIERYINQHGATNTTSTEIYDKYVARHLHPLDDIFQLFNEIGEIFRG